MRRKISAITFIQGLHQNRKPPGSQAIEAGIPSRAKEKGVGAWDFRGKEPNQKDEKE